MISFPVNRTEYAADVKGSSIFRIAGQTVLVIPQDFPESQLLPGKYFMIIIHQGVPAPAPGGGEALHRILAPARLRPLPDRFDPHPGLALRTAPAGQA